MARIRIPPKCVLCGEDIPAKYINMNPPGTRPENMWVGDSFIGWNYDKHLRECRGVKREKDIDSLLNDGDNNTPE